MFARPLNPSESKAVAKWRLVGAVASFLLPLAVYLLTLAPSLNVEDAAEFALGGAALGVDHPSGYPLETLTAHLFTYLPAGDLAGRMNASSAFMAALAALFLYLAAWEILTPTVPGGGARAACAWLAAGLFAFGRSFWPQAVITEVYALNAALVASGLWLGASAAAARDPRRWLALVFVAALGAANHPASLVVAAPLAAWAYARLGPKPRRVALLAAAAALFLVGISVYLYLPLRASRGPALNWGTPFDAPSFLDHVRRREFGTIYWPRYRYLGTHALELARLLLRHYGPGVGVLAPLGAIWLLRRRAPGAGILTALLLLAGPFMLLPLVGLLTPIQTYEIEVWYIPFFLLGAVLAAAAAAAALVRTLGARPALARAATAAAFLLPLYPLVYNWAAADRHGQTFAAEHGRNHLRTYPYRAAMAFPLDEQLGMFEHAYQRFVLGRRADVLLIDPRNTIYNEFTAARGAPRFIVSPDAAETWWMAFRRDFVAANPDRPICYNVDDAYGAYWGVTCVPFGLGYYAQPMGAPAPPWPPPWSRYERRGLDDVERSLSRRVSSYEPTAYRVWANYYAAAAAYDFGRGRADLALADLARARKAVGPDDGVAWLVASAYERYGYPREAIPLYLRALAGAETYKFDALLFRLHYAGLARGLAASYLGLGDVSNAERYLREAAAAVPENIGPGP